MLNQDSMANISKHDGFTNKVLIENSGEDGTITYYLPCYVRFLVKAITSLSLEERKGCVSGTLLFGFHYGKLP